MQPRQDDPLQLIPGGPGSLPHVTVRGRRGLHRVADGERCRLEAGGGGAGGPYSVPGDDAA